MILLLATTYFSCQSLQSLPLSQEQFVSFYIAARYSDETIPNGNNDSLRVSHNMERVRNILSMQNIASDDVLKTVEYYNENPLLWKLFFDSVHSKIAQDEQ